MLFKADLRDSLPRGGGPAAVSIGEVLLLERFVLEDVEDAERGRNRLRRELGFEVCFQLALSNKLLGYPSPVLPFGL